MYFSKSDRFYEMERMMCGIPNFQERGYGSLVLKSDISICINEQPPPSSYNELILITMSAIRYPPFRERLNYYIKEREMERMNFRNEKHREVFEENIEKKDANNYAFISALYLLTADFKLWQVMKNFTGKNEIDFENVRLNGIGENGYTLYCTAKDLYLGTKHISVSDLGDKSLISNKMFALICNAMAIRRFGMKAIQLAEGSEHL